MRLSLSLASPDSPRDRWVVSARAASSIEEHFQPVLLHQGSESSLACRVYFEALIASESFLLKNAFETLADAQEPQSEAPNPEPFDWLSDWPEDFFDQSSRSVLDRPELAYFDAQGVKFIAAVNLSEEETRLKNEALSDPISLIRGGPGALRSLKDKVALLFDMAPQKTFELAPRRGRL